MKIHLIIGSFLLLISCKNEHHKTETQEVDFSNELHALMQGSFTSEKQSLQDSTYYNISLHMYPIWKEHGNYLYVEQALNSMQDKPYRQRVYEISRINDSVYGSAVYEIPNDSLWIGKWKTLDTFNTIHPDSLKTREGCTVYLERIAKNNYKGSTNADDCKSSLRGASYAVSSVEIFKESIESWDQGFNAEKKQVWGAEKGGYVFDRLKE